LEKCSRRTELKNLKTECFCETRPSVFKRARSSYF